MYPKACFCVRITRGEGFFSKKCFLGTSLVVQWLGLCGPNAGAMGSILVRELKSHMPHSTANVIVIIISIFFTLTVDLQTQNVEMRLCVCIKGTHTQTHWLSWIIGSFFFFTPRNTVFIILHIQPYCYEHFFFNILAAQNTLYSVPHLAFGT